MTDPDKPSGSTRPKKPSRNYSSTGMLLPRIDTAHHLYCLLSGEAPLRPHSTTRNWISTRRFHKPLPKHRGPQITENWSWQRDLNPQPPDYKSGALPIAPCQQGARPLGPRAHSLIFYSATKSPPRTKRFRRGVNAPIETFLAKATRGSCATRQA